MKPYWQMRKAVKRVIQAFGFGPCLIEYCNHCGRKQPLTWWADSSLWEFVNRKHFNSTLGALCPECFDRLMLRSRIILRWKPEIHPACESDWKAESNPFT